MGSSHFTWSKSGQFFLNFYAAHNIRLSKCRLPPLKTDSKISKTKAKMPRSFVAVVSRFRWICVKPKKTICYPNDETFKFLTMNPILATVLSRIGLTPNNLRCLLTKSNPEYFPAISKSLLKLLKLPEKFCHVKEIHRSMY